MFSAEQKAALVLDAIQGDDDLNVIAVRNEIAPNQLRNWKNEFIKKASIVFDERRDEKLKQALHEKTEEVDQLYRKIGQLTTEVDWLKKKSEGFLNVR